MPRRKEHEEELALALACGTTVTSAAAKVGIHPRSVYRRLQCETFRRRVQELRTEMWQRSDGMLIAGRPEAIRTLLTLMQGDYPSSVRHSAARSFLESGFKSHTQMEWEERLSTLERQMQAKTGGDAAAAS